VTLSRAYAGDEDLARMQRLVAECWRVRGPLSGMHVGDLPWRMYQHLDKLDEVRVQVWLEDDECVAWGWLWTKENELDFELHPQRPALADDVLAWAEAEAAWALDAHEDAVAALERAGYVRRDGERWYEHHVCELDAELEEPRLPPGYSVRTFHDGDLVRRVDVHRAAFAPSRVVPESYARLQRAWPYRPDLDHVVTAPGGDFAAFCLCWLDDSNAAGLLEPVGTHPDHRRLGLASAVCLAGLRSLREAGASRAVVLSSGGSSATGLYEKIGMPVVARHVAFRREEARASERLHL
jgi:ribosomal protein S18 acetylase RimI-like enzyme